MSSQAFDIAIIGSGPGGYRAAVLAALRGLKAAIIEQGTWGGNCLNRGCVPKKAWYHTARLLADPKRLACRGVRGTLAPDFPQAWRDQRRIVERVRASYVDFLERLGVRAFSGAARFSAPGELTVDGAERVCANSIVVATGSVPIVPATLGLHPDRVLTTDALFDDPPPPGKRIAVVGSGVIGTEMSFILAMLGLKVVWKVVWLTQAEPLTRSRYSAPALKLVRAALADLGIAPRTGNRPLGSRVERGSLRSKRALRRSRSATHVGSYVSSPMRTRERCSARRRWAGRADALAHLASLRYNHPALAEEILNATETLAARWGLGDRVFGRARE